MTLRVLIGTEADHGNILAAAKTKARLRFAAPKNSEDGDLAVVFTPHGLVARASISQMVSKPNKFGNRPARFFEVRDLELLPSPVSLEDIKQQIPSWRWPRHPRRSFCTPQEPLVVAGLQKIIGKASSSAAGSSATTKTGSPTISAVEGERRERVHSRLERDAALVARAKEAWLKKDPTLACFTCGFSFLKTYGVSYVEAHHRVPLAALGGRPRRTTLADLVGVCANCHRVLHIEQGLSPEDLRNKLNRPRSRSRARGHTA